MSEPSSTQPTRVPTGPPASNSSRPPANNSQPPATPGPSTTSPPTPTPTTSEPPPPPPTTTEPPPPPPTTATTTPPPPSTTSSNPTPTTIVTTSVVTPTNGGQPTTLVTTVITQTQPNSQPTGGNGPGTQTTSGTIDPTNKPQGGLSNEGKIAIAVVVPIVAVALLILAGIFLWRKRKQRKDAEEERRKEVEDYTYNRNADPTIPAVAGGYEMKEDGSSGYRGWGSTTLAGSTGRKASTTMSGGAAGGAYSDATSPTRGGISVTRSGDIQDGAHSPEGEILGAMGPPAAANRGGDIRRGPSNASSSYSAAARSDGSGEGPIGAAYGDPTYYNQYGSNNPYADTQFGSPQRPSELTGAPVIRDNPARRNTRIENPAHYPQQSAGISQNF